MSSMRTPFNERTRAFLVILGLLSTISAPAVTIEWGPSPEADIPGKITGYKLYYAPQDFTAPPTNDLPPVAPIILNVGSQTNVVVTNLIGGQTYYFAAVTVDTNGVESDFSNVATFVAPNTEPDPDPGDIPIRVIRRAVLARPPARVARPIRLPPR
jgi:hypothetical protein